LVCWKHGLAFGIVQPPLNIPRAMKDTQNPQVTIFREKE
jgi:hypothetical protein